MNTSLQHTETSSLLGSGAANMLPPRAHVDELTGLRGLAALCIVLNHLLILFPPLKGGPWLPLLKQCGIFGMSLFFTLSGFVIFYNYGQRIHSAPRQGIKKFFIARFARLFPLYIVFLGSFFVFNTLFAGQSIKERFACIITLPLWAVGMQSWFYGFVNDIPLVFLQGRAAVLWSVSTELALYGLFIPLCFLLVRITRPWHMCAGLALLAFLHGVFLYFSWYDGALNVYMNEQFAVQGRFKAWIWLVYYSPLGRLFEFLTGCMAAVVYLHSKKSPRKDVAFTLLAWAMLLCIIALFVYPLQGAQAFIVQPLFIAGFVFCIAQCGSRLLRSPFMVYMGEISYSTYLLQAVWLQFLQYSGENMWARLAVFTVYVLGTYSLAHVVYTRLEVPGRRKVLDMLGAGRSSRNA